MPVFIAGTSVVYGCVVNMHDWLVRKSDGGFDRVEYREYPERYESTFNAKVCLLLQRTLCICWIPTK